MRLGFIALLSRSCVTERDKTMRGMKTSCEDTTHQFPTVIITPPTIRDILLQEVSRFSATFLAVSAAIAINRLLGLL